MQIEQGQLMTHRRRGVVIVLTAVMLVVILGFAALTIDVGAIYNTRVDLQNAADAAALGSASELSRIALGRPVDRARKTAYQIVKQNPVFGGSVTIDPAADLVFGRAEINEATGRIRFVETEVQPDAVRVIVRKTEDSPNGPMPTFFAGVFGKHHVNVSASAVAFLAPRDIAIVADLSGSINDDSELKNYKLTWINLFDVWRALPQKQILPGVQPSWIGLDAPPPVSQTVANQPIDASTTVANLPGPAWGFMKGLGFGTPLNPSTYDPAKDDGLVRLPSRANWSVPALAAYLKGRNYSDAEVTAIQSAAFDGNGAYPYRTAVALGLAYWNSGTANGLWSSRGATKGNGDNRIDAGELEWVQPVLGRTAAASSAIWTDYINYTANARSGLNNTAPEFQFHFGIKTFVNYLLDARGSFAATPELGDTPAQPMQAIKDAAGYMLEMITDMETNDRVSLQIYGTTAHHEADLTQSFLSVFGRLKIMQAGHYDGWTNMGGGMATAINELSGERARSLSKKVLVLLTDGNANVSETGKTGDAAGGRAYAIKEARRAASLGMTVFAISVGAGADQGVMKEIADITGGVHFHAEGSIEKYSEQLRDIFTEIGSRRAVELIE